VASTTGVADAGQPFCAMNSSHGLTPSTPPAASGSHHRRSARRRYSVGAINASSATVPKIGWLHIANPAANPAKPAVRARRCSVRIAWHANASAAISAMNPVV
jgi:hypothetical protein